MTKFGYPYNDLVICKDRAHWLSRGPSDYIMQSGIQGKTMVQWSLLLVRLDWSHLMRKIFTMLYISSKIPTDVSYICFKNIAKLHLQSNNLP